MSKIYLVPTPIGNLEDMTFRAIKILKEVDFILAEDTRTSGKLLKHFEIGTQMHSHHMHNEHKSIEGILNRIRNGETCALISDAGTPAISDPGFLLTRACVENNIEVDCLPGATAFVPALVKSGLPCDRFIYEGFIPHKKGRKTLFEDIKERKITTVLYESPHRIVKTLAQMVEFIGEDRQISISRELTKKFEETINGSISEVLAIFEQKTIKGEFVMVVKGKD